MNLPTKTSDLLIYVLLLFYWIAVSITYFNLPEQIPIHYNGSGEVDAFGNKNSIFTLPVIASIQTLLISLLIKNPDFLVFHPQNKNLVLKKVRMLKSLRIILLIAFIYIDYTTITISFNEEKTGLGKAFLPSMLIALLVPILIYTFCSTKIKLKNRT